MVRCVYKSEVKEMKKALKEIISEFGFVAWILILTLFAIAVLGVGGLVYKSTIGKADADIQREVFENNKSHVHAMIEDLSKYKLELARTEDEVERKAIINFIVENYATFDGELIKNDSLRVFYYDVFEGRIK